MLMAAAPRTGASVPLAQAQMALAPRGFTQDMLPEALENWESLNLLDWPQRGSEVGLVADAWHTQVWHLDAGEGGGERQRRAQLEARHQQHRQAPNGVPGVAVAAGHPEALVYSVFA